MQPNTRTVIQRIVLGAAAIAFLLSLSIADVLIAQWASRSNFACADLLSRGSVLPLTFLMLVAKAVHELLRLLRARGMQPVGGLAYFLTMLLLVLPWLGPAGYLGQSVADREGLYWSVAAVSLGVMLIGTACVLRKNPTRSIEDFGSTLLVVLYLGFLGSFALQIRCGWVAPHHQGVWLLFIVVLVTKSSDIGAYLVGTFVGRHKLIPEVSPGKTVEGAIGGLLASGLVAVIFVVPGQMLTTRGNDLSRFWLTWKDMTWSFGDMFPNNGFSLFWQPFVFGTIISGFAQMGDLFESCLKRASGTKDSGSVMPHYGGILDLVDSPLFGIPAAWVMLTRVWNLP